MRQLEAGGGLERMSERVAEVQLAALAAVVRVAQADRGLERRAAPHLLGQRQLPERLAGEQAGLDHLGAPVLELGLRQRLERRRVDHRPHRPVEGADQVLPARQVDRRLAADRGVDLADERRRHGDPVDAAEVRRGGEARGVRRAAAAERDERAATLEPQRVPERLQRLDALRLLARRELVARSRPRSERELGVHAVDPGDPRVADQLDRAVAHELAESLQRPRLDVDAAGDEHAAVEVPDAGVGGVVVERPPLVVERPECSLVLRERPVAAANPPPRLLRLDLDEHRQRALPQRLADLVGPDRTAAQRDHGGRARSEGVARVLRLAQPERRLAAGLEDPRDRLLALDLGVDVDERPPELRGELLAEGRLARTHEADQSDVTV